MLAIIETGGKQYQATEGRYITVELIDAKQDEQITLDKVVMIVNGEKSLVGTPYVEGATVSAKVLEHGKDTKVLVYKQKRKKGYRKKQGHRQQFTKLMIESIDFAGKEKVVAKEEKAEDVKVEKKSVAKKTTAKKIETTATEKKTTAKKAEVKEENAE
ncbi:MAG: 50S ribosomal protein L21 [Candidatus Gastranaerophilales bacterium]|nr:50S ribosomal protein L21 [Candidatus Gastranaerophilales bacterium]